MMLVLGCLDRLEALMHSSVLQELALKCGRSGNVSSLENIFHSHFGWQGWVPVDIPLSGIKSILALLWNGRKRAKLPILAHHESVHPSESGTGYRSARGLEHAQL